MTNTNYETAKQTILELIDKYERRHIGFNTAYRAIFAMTKAFTVANFITKDEADALYNVTTDIAADRLD
jgi:hypothetical protein